jgi:hypothetical protein
MCVFLRGATLAALRHCAGVVALASWHRGIVVLWRHVHAALVFFD